MLKVVVTCEDNNGESQKLLDIGISNVVSGLHLIANKLDTLEVSEKVPDDWHHVHITITRES